MSTSDLHRGASDLHRAEEEAARRAKPRLADGFGTASRGRVVLAVLGLGAFTVRISPVGLAGLRAPAAVALQSSNGR